MRSPRKKPIAKNIAPSGNEMTKSVLIPLIFIILACVSLIAWVTIFWSFTADDAFITFRYSANLINGGSATYNLGQPPIEGYTTFLWMILMTIPHLLHFDVVVFSKIAGIVSTLGFIVVASLFTHHATPFLKGPERLFPAVFVALLLACYGPTSIHAVSGMETSFFTFLMISFLYTLTLFAESPILKRRIYLCLFALLLGLTRPEGNLVAMAGLIAVLFIIPRTNRFGLVGSGILFYGIPAIIYYYLRLHYYGLPFPLSYYVKVLSDKPGLLDGLSTVTQFIVSLGPLLWILIVAGLVTLKKNHLPAGIAVLSFLVFYLFPNHILGFDWRFLFPAVPFLFSIGGIGLGMLLNLIETKTLSDSRNARGARIHLTRALILLSVVICIGALPSQRKISEKENYASGMFKAHIPLGQHLAKFPHDESSPILAISDAGAVPYYSGWRTIDTFGLNEPYIATSGVRDPVYVLDQHPDLLVVISKDPYTFNPRLDFEGGLYIEAIKRGMTVALVMEFFDGYYLWCLSWPGSEVGGWLGQK
jgi:arabinofuranosyltransferase